MEQDGGGEEVVMVESGLAPLAICASKPHVYCTSPTPFFRLAISLLYLSPRYLLSTHLLGIY